MAPSSSQSLARVLEPEVMDTAEEASDYDAMDHSAVNDQFCDDVLAARSKAGNHGGRFLDVGTGTALIPIGLCRRDATVSVVGIDMAEHMLGAARKNVQRAFLDGRITLQRSDAKGTPWHDGAFDVVVSNSIVHHIPAPREAFAEMLRLVAPGGLLFVRDLVRPASDIDVQRLVDMYAPVPHHLEPEAQAMHERQRSLLDASLRAALNLYEVRQIVEPLGISASSLQVTSDRHWTLAFIKPGSTSPR